MMTDPEQPRSATSSGIGQHAAKRQRFGPGMLVAAAFIGPGTVTTASKAGAGFGFALSWAIVFSILATIVLQEMAARLGLVTRQGLGEAVRSSSHNSTVSLIAGLTVAIAIGLGNAAYQTGNIVGAAMGASLILGGTIQVWSAALGLTAFALLYSGRYRLIEFALIALVLLMSGTFLVTAFMVRPNVFELARGSFSPSIPEGSLLTIIGLIGTTVVPYNLFLQASSVCRKWPNEVPRGAALREARIDTFAAVTLGGIVTLAIVATAATAFFGRGGISSPGDMARQLEPLLGGSAARIFFSAGLLAVGLTSSITAPLAAAFAICGAMRWSPDLNSARFRAVWMSVLAVGTALSAAGLKSPQVTILIAQAINGLLLPLISIFLLIAVNRSDLMGQHKNGLAANLLGVLVVFVTMLLGGTAFYRIWQS